jgi:prepilin-type N-terminal cleavage/methylation domain-containing protein
LRGFTLIEMLVAVAITMIMMLAVTQVFLYLGDNMDKARSIIEMSGQLRNVSQRLQEDLDGLTCSTLPWTKLDAGDGYFEYLEGTNTDTTGGATSFLGDADDILMFTSRSKGRPFVGMHGTNTVESELAEIIWWTSAPDATGVRTLHRRCLLIRPDLNAAATDDISRSNATGTSNSLADLTLRQNRAVHNSVTFPHQINTLGGLTPHASGRETVLSNVVGFDVKAWDPLAPLMNGTLSTLVPGDPGYAVPGTPIGRGAYVDLGYANDRTVSLYSGAPNPKSLLAFRTYSTWPFFYECDGVDQDNYAGPDQGTNGFDDEPNPSLPPVPAHNLAVDDPSEYETSPPYPHLIANMKSPGLRGIQARIRLVETGSRQVRQSTVVSEFLPE